MPYILIFVLLVASLYGLRLWTKHQACQKLLNAPLSDLQRSIVVGQVPLYNKLPRELRGKLEGKINLFLHQIEFVGCGGLEVTEEMRLSIATQACMLIVNKEMWYKNLRTVLVYPGAFKSRVMNHSGYIVTEREVVRVGESWARGPVILSWAHAEEGAFIDNDGHNVVFHEFAHQLDDLSGYTDAAPILSRDHSLGEWNRVFSEAYERLVNTVEASRTTIIDSYGATSPVEYFAVVVELFFEKPVALKREEPAVYVQLLKFFELDPAGWK